MSVDDPLQVGEIEIPAAEFVWQFDPSGGPGGQHANKASTRVTLSFDLGNSPTVPDDLRTRMLGRLGSKAPDGTVTVVVDETRSQWRNRAIARRRLGELLEQASRRRKRRIRTRPSRSAKKRRLEKKRRRSEIKRLRKPPERD